MRDAPARLGASRLYVAKTSFTTVLASRRYCAAAGGARSPAQQARLYEERVNGRCFAVAHARRDRRTNKSKGNHI